jgi:hypothetical protein
MARRDPSSQTLAGLHRNPLLTQERAAFQGVPSTLGCPYTIRQLILELSDGRFQTQNQLFQVRCNRKFSGEKASLG